MTDVTIVTTPSEHEGSESEAIESLTETVEELAEALTEEPGEDDEAVHDAAQDISLTALAIKVGELSARMDAVEERAAVAEVTADVALDIANDADAAIAEEVASEVSEDALIDALAQEELAEEEEESDGGIFDTEPKRSTGWLSRTYADWRAGN